MADLAWLLFSNDTDRVLLGLLGILASVYSLYIEIRKAKEPQYRAWCDFNDSMSCSRVLTSRYGKGFGVVGYLVGENNMMNLPNCVLGIVFYTFQIIAVYWSLGWITSLAYFMSIIACIGSVYLAYILFAVLKDVCVLCMATYVLNAGFLFLLYSSYNHL